MGSGEVLSNQRKIGLFTMKILDLGDASHAKYEVEE